METALVILLTIIGVSVIPFIVSNAISKQSGIVSIIFYLFFGIQTSVGFFGIPVSEWGGVLLCIALPLIYLHYRTRPGLIPTPGKKPISMMFFSLAMSVIYAIFFSNNSDIFLSKFDFNFIFGIICFYCIFFLLSLDVLKFDRLLKSILFSGVPIVIYPMLKIIKIKGVQGLSINRLGSFTTVNPNTISSFLDILLPVAIFLALNEKRKTIKILYLGLTVIYTVGIYLTSSRGSLPGVMIIVLYLGRALYTKKQIILFAIFVGAIFSILFNGDSHGAAKRLVKPNRADLVSDFDRIRLYKAAQKALEINHYIFGMGINTFTRDKFKYGFPRWLDNKKALSSHNFYLEVWLGWGVLALAGWLTLSLGLTLRLAKTKIEASILPYKKSIILALIGFSLHSLVDSVMTLTPIILILFTLFACTAYLINFKKSA